MPLPEEDIDTELKRLGAKYKAALEQEIVGRSEVKAA